MVSKGRHPKNPIANALAALDGERFEVVEVHKGHRWGVVSCRACGATTQVWSTPRVPEHNAQAIARFAHNHTH
ncbi:hypothetical protein N8K70_04070 [Microbacterium betulae]|uniref:Uncharacterized protein n=1 Tax=Microbacterium betulae TaxID=2981139 RepID=A0AA97FJF8_9MICO|nr:hypothetical protein [Microbacterium sp. AB]WOF23868.1 hypothetical protein N8K70_04070 [Microbacterium sp. AB]